jgi:FkbM family methyltransferase
MYWKAIINYIVNNIIKILPRKYNEEIFYRIGKILGVLTFTYETKLGIFEGSINDKILFKYYVNNNIYAPGLHYILNNLFSNGTGTFIDIGANIGLISIPIAKVNEKINIFAFEPEPNNYIIFRKNIIANGVERKIKTFNMALFSEDCRLNMELSEDNMGDHRIRIKNNSNAQGNYFNELSRPTIQIQACKLDSLLKAQELIKPIILKVDTQGAEVKVLSGARNFLKEVDYLIMEYWPYGLKKIGDSPELLLSQMNHFSWGAVFDDTQSSLPKLSPIGELVNYLEAWSEQAGKDHLDILLSRNPF